MEKINLVKATSATSEIQQDIDLNQVKSYKIQFDYNKITSGNVTSIGFRGLLVQQLMVKIVTQHGTNLNIGTYDRTYKRL